MVREPGFLPTVSRVAAGALFVIGAASVAAAKSAPPATIAKAGPAPVREIEAARPFVRDGDLHLQFGAESGLLRHAYRRQPPTGVAKTQAPRQAADAFLAQWASHLGLDAAQVTLVSEKQSPSGTHYRYDQHLHGVPVYRAEIVLKVNHDHEISSLHSTLRPGLRVSTKAVVDAAAARSAARAVVQPTGKPLGPVTSVLQVVETDAGGRLAWLVSMPVEEPMGDWLVFVDAHTGAILGVEDRMLYVDGSGRTFDPDPRTKMNNPALIDNGDADSAVPFPAAYDDRALLGLTQMGINYLLSGPYARMLDFESPAGAPVTSTDPNGFFFQRSAQGFEDVMCYFHIDQNQRYIQSLGFTNINNRVQEIDSHGLNGADNSHYVVGTTRLAFGEGGVDDAEDADVVLHEYGHSIQHNIVPGWGGGHEGAMGEGFGDYWAGSYSVAVNPTFETRFVFNWDGHNAFWPGRVLVDSTTHYPENCCGQVHASGTLWCSGLTDCWRRVGRTVMDRIVLDHHFAIGTSATMADAATQVIQSDIDLYGGAHLATLVPVLDFWGFVNADDYVPQIAHAPLGDTNDTTGPYPVTATVTSVQPLAAGSPTLYWGIGAFTDSLSMSATMNPNEYSAAIPGPLTGVPVRYYIRARDANGGTSVQPAGAPGSYYVFHVGPNNGAISGRVRLANQTDHSGVLVTVQPGGASAMTNMAGDYSVPNLYVDSYQLVATKSGYATSTRSGVAVALATTTEHQDFVLFQEQSVQVCNAPNALIPEGIFPLGNNITVTPTWQVQGVEVDVNITHPNIGQLTMDLVHGATTVRLHDLGGGTADNIIGTYPTTLTVSGPGSLADFVGLAANGTWQLRLADTVFDGSMGRLVSWCLRLRGPADIVSDAGPEAGPVTASLWQSEPNPAHGGITEIRFALPRAARASLVLFDIAGRRVRTLVDGGLAGGPHAVRWDGRDDRGTAMPAGVYVYRLQAADVTLTQKLVSIR